MHGNARGRFARRLAIWPRGLAFCPFPLPPAPISSNLGHVAGNWEHLGASCGQLPACFWHFSILSDFGQSDNRLGLSSLDPGTILEQSSHAQLTFSALLAGTKPSKINGFPIVFAHFHAFDFVWQNIHQILILPALCTDLGKSSNHSKAILAPAGRHLRAISGLSPPFGATKTAF